jgi:hypothetical protein
LITAPQKIRNSLAVGTYGPIPITWLAGQPAHRFEFTFTPKHGSRLNLIEGFFSKLARSVLRHIRVASKQELKDRLMAAMFALKVADGATMWGRISGLDSFEHHRQ